MDGRNIEHAMTIRLGSSGRVRQRGAGVAPEPGGEENEKVFLLGWSQRFNRRFDFGKRAHGILT